MIPLVLRLQNFMSYAELDLDLRGIHSAVLSGPNGAGKSTLLDAITYALWDKARAGAEHLIRLGQAEMWAELTFELEGEVYRIWRRRIKKSGAQSQLEFHQLATGADLDEEAAWVSLTGSTIRETQAKVNQVVRMDYDTFVNSAFILQGRADEFTTKTPKERKAVLAEILGLKHYDELSTKARERWKAAQAKADLFEGEQADLRVRLERVAQIDTRMAVLEAALEDVALRLKQAETRQSRLLGEEQAFKSAQSRQAELEAARRQALEERGRVEAEMARHRTAMDEASRQAEQAGAIEAAFAEWEAVQAEETALRQVADRYHALDAELVSARAALAAARHRHELDRRAQESELAGLERERAGLEEVLRDREKIDTGYQALVAARAAEAAHLDKALAARKAEERRRVIEREVETIRARAAGDRQEKLARLARYQEELRDLDAVRTEAAETEASLKSLAVMAVEQDRIKEKGFAYRAAHDRALAAIESAKAAATAKTAKLEQLTHAHAGVGSVSAEAHHCPLCETVLSEGELAKIIAQYQAEIQGFEDEAARQADEAARAERQLLDSRARYAELTDKLKRRESLQLRAGELTNRIKTLEGTLKALNELALELEKPLEVVLPEALSGELTALESELTALAYDPAELAVIQAKLNDYRWAESRHWQLEQALVNRDRLEGQLPAARAALEASEATWASQRETLERQEQELALQVAALGYDRQAHVALQKRLEALAEAPKAHAELQKRLLWLESAQTLLARLEAEAAQHALKAAEADAEHLRLARVLDRYPLWQSEMAAVEIELKRVREDERLRHEERGRLEAERAALEEARLRLNELEAEWKTLVEDAQAYKELSSAFGKDGIQAAIIENAIPEIEEEANRLLARMTDNRMHVRLATQREKKTGGVHETLEIYISDEVGIRNYELYSGGEAFRVDFALRLSLSRLLARRAGARLQTLVIDEGFGTQDERGREKLIEAISAVSGEFARIFVITHIRELKEAFNTQIEVSKRGGVSEVKLIA